MPRIAYVIFITQYKKNDYIGYYVFGLWANPCSNSENTNLTIKRDMMNNVKTIAKLKKRIIKTLKNIEEIKTQIKEKQEKFK